MCIVIISHGDERFPLVIVHNRDEVLTRETSPPEEHPGSIVYARDGEKGGTYMGLNLQTGAVAVRGSRVEYVL